MGKKPSKPHTENQCRLLITGIPGTGKTFVGNYLGQFNGFQHIDFETMESLEWFYSDKNEFLAAIAPPIVITWGFVPDQQTEDILLLKENGFRLIWFDGNRPAALREFIHRNTVPQAAFYAQLYKIEAFNTIASIVPDLVFNTFDEQGQFKQVDIIAEELLQLC